MVDRIDIPLELDGFEVTASDVVDGVLIVDVQSTTELACHHCGSKDVIGHGRCERRIRDRACTYPCVLRWSQRRLRCRDCTRTCRERHPELAGRRSITTRFHHHLFERAIDEPTAHVAATEAVSSYRVTEAFETHAGRELVATPLEPPRVVSVDESAFCKRCRFHTLLSDPEKRHVFEFVEGRGEAQLAGALLGLNPQVRAGIETVVIDLFWPYRRAIEKILPEARIVADKFHVLRALDQACQRVRRRYGKRLRAERLGRGGRMAPRQVISANDPQIFSARWVLMKRAAKLRAEEQQWLESIFQRVPELRCAWLLKEAFAAIYDAPDRAEADARLEVWVHNMRAADLPEFVVVWGQLQQWREQILNYFDDPFTNAFSEGITNRIKVMKRRSYGFRNSASYRLKVLLACGPRRTK